MAIWDKITSRGQVEDRRGSSFFPLAGGGLGLGGLILLLVMNYLGGGDLNDALNGLQYLEVPVQEAGVNFDGADQYEVFASTVLGSNNDAWSEIFARNNLEYVPPRLVLFRGATQGGCGIASNQVGPHYCPSDRTIYLDETFFDELQRRFNANGGDVAEAYVISHEVGHHVQNLLGIMDQVTESGSNDLSVKLELQADCFAGLWAHSIKDEGVFESPDEIKEALDAAAAVGDDRIQQSVEGRISPESWTHGSSEQRVNAFNAGYTTGNVGACNTF